MVRSAFLFICGWELMGFWDAVVQAGDYIAMGLLAPIDSQWTPRLTLNFVLEKIESILPGLILQVSSDGYHWVRPPLAPLARSH